MIFYVRIISTKSDENKHEKLKEHIIYAPNIVDVDAIEHLKMKGDTTKHSVVYKAALMLKYIKN